MSTYLLIVRWGFKNTTPKHCAPNYDAMKLDKYKDVHTLVIKFKENESKIKNINSS